MKKIKSLSLIIIITFLLVAIKSSAQKEILLWPNGAPGSEGKTGEERISKSARGEISISNVHHPSITPYLPAKEKATGVAMIIAPGGGHSTLKMDYEGSNITKILNEKGITAFVLKYRLAKEPGSTYTVDEHAEADMQRAIRLVKSRAAEWGLDTAKIGVLGFSADGEIAGLSPMRFDSAKLNSKDVIDRQSSGHHSRCWCIPATLHGFHP
jgi:endo-1,4-beta-xylanase